MDKIEQETHSTVESDILIRELYNNTVGGTETDVDKMRAALKNFVREEHSADELPKSKLIGVLDFISQKDISEGELYDLKEVLRAFSSISTSTPMENLSNLTMMQKCDFIDKSYFKDDNTMLALVSMMGVTFDTKEAHKPVIEYFGSLPSEYMNFSAFPDQMGKGKSFGAEEIARELDTIRSAVQIRTSEFPYDEQVQKIKKLIEELGSAKKVEESKPEVKKRENVVLVGKKEREVKSSGSASDVLSYIDTLSKEDLQILDKIFAVYCSPNKERDLLSDRITKALFEMTELARFIPHNYAYNYESEIRIHGEVYHQEDKSKAILSSKQEENPVTSYLTHLPDYFEGDVRDEVNYEHTSYTDNANLTERSQKREEIKKIQEKIAAKLRELSNGSSFGE